MYCKHCGEELIDGQTFCIKCENPVEEEQPEENFEASAPPKKSTNQEHYLNGRNKIIVIILNCYLGFLGIHNFYMGENKKGAAKILTCFLGIGMILSIIDLIKIIKNTYKWSTESFF